MPHAKKRRSGFSLQSSAIRMAKGFPLQPLMRNSGSENSNVSLYMLFSANVLIVQKLFTSFRPSPRVEKSLQSELRLLAGARSDGL